MADNSIYKLHAEVCKALGNPLRIEIIDLLQNNELCFSDILAETGGLKSTLSQHLSVMVSKGILHQHKEGQNVYFKLSSPKVAKACGLMREVLMDYLKKHKTILEKM
jgi:ArsR family transcriptional regulator